MSASPRALLPPALRSGARIAIVSPASSVNPDRVRVGVAALASLGYEPVLSPHALTAGPVSFAGSAQQRVADLHAAFADPSIDAICCTRGGWGTAELLPLLNADLVRAHPKPFLGYSDHTSLHTWFANETGLVTFHAPMVSPDFARGTPADALAGVDLPSWHAALHHAEPWVAAAPEGLRLLRPGAASEYRISGTLWGGCLAILAEALGTPFAPRPRPGSILFLEDVNTKPYQWDRMLLHMRYAGALEGVQAIVFGNMEQCVAAADLPLVDAALLHSLAWFPGPLCIGLRSGHVHGPNVTLPLGVEATLLPGEQPELHIAPAVNTTPAPKGTPHA